MFRWGGLSCCISATALYLLGRADGREADVLKSATRVNELNDLASLFDIGCNVIPLVSVTGQVGSDTTIRCKRNGSRGVIVEENAEQHFLKLSDNGSWIQDHASLPSVSKEVPWYLDDGTGRVLVVRARTATGLILDVASEVFEESGKSIFRGTLDYLQGIKMLGVKRTERILPIGTSLTVVGEAVKDNSGKIRIQSPPHKGSFYVSTNSIDKLIEVVGKWSSFCKIASMGFAIFGCFLLVMHHLQYHHERRQREELQNRVEAAEAAARQAHEARDNHGEAESSSSNKKNDGLPLDICIVCLEQPYNAVFVPCGHMCCCILCSTRLRNCPLCRKKIKQTVRTFRH